MIYVIEIDSITYKPNPEKNIYIDLFEILVKNQGYVNSRTQIHQARVIKYSPAGDKDVYTCLFAMTNTAHYLINF